MEAWQERVALEAEELRDKHAKLAAFLLTGKFRELPLVDRMLLRRQLFVMTDYLSILSDRMVRFDGGAVEDP